MSRSLQLKEIPSFLALGFQFTGYPIRLGLKCYNGELQIEDLGLENGGLPMTGIVLALPLLKLRSQGLALRRELLDRLA